MNKIHFEAGTQYGDMKGTISADKHDTYAINNYLLDNNLIEKDEFVVGINVSIGELHKKLAPDDTVFVTIYLYDKQGYDSFAEELKSRNKLKLRNVEIRMMPHEFLSFFKRFNLTLSPAGMLEGKTFETNEPS